MLKHEIVRERNAITPDIYKTLVGTMPHTLKLLIKTERGVGGMKC